MQVRTWNTRSSQKIVFTLAAGLLSLPALAGTPGVLDHVPSDAHAVLVVPNIGELLNDINKVNTLLGESGQPMVMMITSMIRGMPGLNLDGSLAGVASFDDGIEEEPEVVFLLPVSDFGAFSEGHASQDGLYEMDMGDKMLYFRNAGDGFVVFGDDDGLVEDFDAASGNLKANASVLGGNGGQVASGNDISLYFNFNAFEGLIEEAMEEMEAQGEMVEMMGGAEAVAGFDMMLDFIQTLANDGSSFAFGVNFDAETGISHDLAIQFKEDSASASYLQNKGDAGKFFNNAPAMDYFFASAFDISGSGIQKLIGEYMGMIKQFDTTGMVDQMGFAKLMDGMTGGIQVMGASDNVMGGLFSKSFQYMEVDDADGFIDASRSMYDGMGQMEELAMVGIEVNALIDDEPTEINGVEAYGYSFAMDMSGMEGMADMGGMNPGMILSMIFGADGGPSGYMAKVGNGVVSTFSKDAEFFSMVADGANGKNTMMGDASIAKTSAMLPKNRIAETYIAADHLINTAGPMMMMFGVIPEFEPMDAMAPIGFGVSADGGGLLIRAVVPMQTIGAVMEMIPEDAFGGEDDDDMDF